MPRKIPFDWVDNPYDEPFELRLQYANAKQILIDYLDWRLAGHVLWLPWYKELVEWLTDNEGKGLLLYGPQYVGKTTIVRDFIPQLLRTTRDISIQSISAKVLNNVYATHLGTPFLHQYIKILENLGIEKKINDYGIRFEPFNKVVDDAIARNKFLVISTNFTPEELAKRYGYDTIHNLSELCKFIECKPRDA